ncbi:MAG: rRNA pseudouridine synthase, partial [Cytophagales bacterium]
RSGGGFERKRFGDDNRSDKPQYDDRPKFGDRKKTVGYEKEALSASPKDSEKIAEDFVNDLSDNFDGLNEDQTSSSSTKFGRGKSTHGAPKKPFSEKKNDRQSVEEDDAGIRLNRYLAQAGIASRREADELIRNGQVTVNDEIIREMGYKVQSGDQVHFKGKLVSPEKLVYLLLNKPKDYITTTEDPHERHTVMELVEGACKERIYPVGRLDRDTTGLLLFTNDGELAKKLTHPSHQVKKIYRIELDKGIKEEDFKAINEGITLEDGPIKPDALALLTEDARQLGIEIHEGRNRIVRRIFESFGYDVVRLDRTVYAGLTKENIPRGQYRFLNDREITRLKYFTGKK